MSLHRVLQALAIALLVVCLQVRFSGSAGADSAQLESVHARRLARGRYLVDSLAHCFLCHSDEDFAHLAGQPVPGKMGAGRIVPPDDSGIDLPHRVVCPNITPDRATGAGLWTDAQFERAIRHGIGHDGRVLSDYMPYWGFSALSDEDIASVIAYLRGIPGVYRRLPKQSLPQEPRIEIHADILPPMPPPNAPELLRRGYYLVRIGNCTACHTPTDAAGVSQPKLLFAGGSVLRGKWGTAVSLNITPDPSGISYFTLAQFKQVLRTGYVGARKLNPIMPWSYFRHLTDDDIAAIYAYLRTLPPIHHNVDNTEPPTYCRICGNRHGYGNRN